MPANPYESPSVAGETRRGAPRRPRVWLTLLGSLAVMIPWPILGIGVCIAGNLFEQAIDAVLLFGSVTLLLLIAPCYLMGLEPSEVLIGIVIIVVWIFVLIAPSLWAVRRRPTGPIAGLLFILQTVFAMAQAAFGFLMILGRSV